MFTFSFGSTIAWADTTKYEASDYETALQGQKTNVLSYLATAKSQAVNAFTFNDEGFAYLTEDTGIADGLLVGYTKAALERAADEVISDATEAIDKAINAKLAEDIYPTTSKVSSTFVEDVLYYDADNDGAKEMGDISVADLEIKATMLTQLKAEVETLDKAQASLTKDAVNAKLDAIDLT